MPCKPCEERWRIILAQQSKTINMKDLKKIDETQIEVSEEQVISSNDNVSSLAISNKLDFNKLVEDRRKALLEKQIINK